MKLWIDAQLSPDLAAWLAATFGVEAAPVRALGLRDAADRAIFFAARNTSNARLRALLAAWWPKLTALLEGGEPLVEIAGD